MGEKTLSKNLLQMKFMQKSRLRMEAATADKSTKALEESYLKPFFGTANRCKFRMQPRIAISAGLYECGRFSFQGFNPEVEKAMAYHEALRKGLPQDEDMEKQGRDVDDDEMTSRFSSISQNLQKKFTKKRLRSQQTFDDEDDKNSDNYHVNSKKRKFKKPSDD